MDINKSIIRGLEPFHDLDDDILEEILEHSVLRSYSKGEEVFVEGREGRHVFFLVAGDVRVYKTTPEGREITVTLATEGEMFGEAILRHGQRYPATAVCSRDSMLLLLDKKFIEVLLTNQRFISKFLFSLLKRMRHLSSRISYLTSYDVEERFFQFLENRYGRCTRCTLDLPKGEIAKSIGTIPETFSRMLKRLEKRGDIELRGKKLNIKEGVWDIYTD